MGRVPLKAIGDWGDIYLLIGRAIATKTGAVRLPL